MIRRHEKSFTSPAHRNSHLLTFSSRSRSVLFEQIDQSNNRTNLSNRVAVLLALKATSFFVFPGCRLTIFTPLPSMRLSPGTIRNRQSTHWNCNQARQSNVKMLSLPYGKFNIVILYFSTSKRHSGKRARPTKYTTVF